MPVTGHRDNHYNKGYDMTRAEKEFKLLKAYASQIEDENKRDIRIYVSDTISPYIRKKISEMIRKEIENLILDKELGVITEKELEKDASILRIIYKSL